MGHKPCVSSTQRGSLSGSISLSGLVVVVEGGTGLKLTKALKAIAACCVPNMDLPVHLRVLGVSHGQVWWLW